MPLITVACLIAAASGSIKIANSEGERGHPCLVPLLRQKLEDVCCYSSYGLVSTLGVNGKCFAVLVDLIINAA